jgi:hypothetical protein
MAERNPQLVRHVVIDRAGMGFLLSYAKFRKLVDDLMRFDLKLPRQLVNPNLSHR